MTAAHTCSLSTCVMKLSAPPLRLAPATGAPPPRQPRTNAGGGDAKRRGRIAPRSRRDESSCPLFSCASPLILTTLSRHRPLNAVRGQPRPDQLHPRATESARSHRDRTGSQREIAPRSHRAIAPSDPRCARSHQEIAPSDRTDARGVRSRALPPPPSPHPHPPTQHYSTTGGPPARTERRPRWTRSSSSLGVWVWC